MFCADDKEIMNFEYSSALIIGDVESELKEDDFDASKYILTMHKPDSSVKLHSVNPSSLRFLSLFIFWRPWN
jgi:hypothetical protein